ncbi:MAG: 4Fe-4S dicluster domain-containing protein [Bacteroidales bacterium]|nr:4Fe-4S dicluster domain-containing protein [Bacteroidales bacterium]MCF8457665.1 4Fe-4S dicluster domain-containing protein [Bacteroidales bacterium]
MSYRVDFTLKHDLKKFGIHDWNECFHCGNCTAICPMTKTGSLFPRKDIRLLQMGLKDKLATNLDPWLCYYCGECTETCPRDANPGELMMSLRRYLTSVYDWTGLSKKFYTSHFWEFGFIFFFFCAVIASFLIWLPLSGNTAELINDQGGVMINNLVAGISGASFVNIIEIGDWTMAILVAGLLISNILHMFYRVVIRDKEVKVPVYAYITEFWSLIWQFMTQSKFSKCEGKTYWVGHLLLMTGYSIMFAVIVVLLPEFQIEEVRPWYNWQRLMGYYATFGILFFLVYVTISRIRKSDWKSKFSHPTDWLFIVMLGLTTITGILVHIFRIGGMVSATYYMYVIHLAVLVPMILVEVPFSKWSHLAYRPFAIYFDRLKEYSRKSQNENKLVRAA